jgi:hypothetical protein
MSGLYPKIRVLIERRCGRLELGLKDGSDHAALFRFRH